MAKREASFLAFFLVWAERQRWKVPDCHIRAAHWLQHRGDLAVLRCFRGFGKSTLLAVYNAWRYWGDPEYRILHQSEADGTAYKTSRDTQNVLRRHPWTAGMLPDKAGPVEQWWVNGASDARNASMYARGILSNVTSARADECQNDDVEVPRNIQTPEAREKLRYRLGEQTHILVPGGRTLYIGTPHTHDSLYDEVQALGADCLTIKMFEHEHRVDDCKLSRVDLPFVPAFVFSGIGKPARLLEEGQHYRIVPGGVEFAAPPGGLVDFYAGSSWPERFDAAELLKRRRKTRTVNEWDSQYQLHSKPVTETRLDPARMIPYDVAARLVHSNGGLGMWLGNARIASASLRWDPAGGKLLSDVSACALVLQDDHGRRYAHRVKQLTGDVAEFSEDGKTITGGQVWQLCDLVKELAVPRITVETNGIGTFAPAVLKAALKQRRLQCGVSEVTSIEKKNKRILEALEPLLLSRGMLWAHVDVLRSPLYDQMRSWNPAYQNQDDDYIDALAGAVTDTPERIGRLGGNGLNVPSTHGQDWRPDAGAHEVEVEY